MRCALHFSHKTNFKKKHRDVPNGNPHSGISAVLVDFFAVLVEKSTVLAENASSLLHSLTQTLCRKSRCSPPFH